jgi:hypothetical protein
VPPSLYISAHKLSKGDVILLPFGKQATVINDPKVGRTFVTYVTEFGKTRVDIRAKLHVLARAL